MQKNAALHVLIGGKRLWLLDLCLPVCQLLALYVKFQMLKCPSSY